MTNDGRMTNNGRMINNMDTRNNSNDTQNEPSSRCNELKQLIQDSLQSQYNNQLNELESKLKSVLGNLDSLKNSLQQSTPAERQFSTDTKYTKDPPLTTTPLSIGDILKQEYGDPSDNNSIQSV